ncbi:hypothetical protein [Aureivirga sp. CE67]|uniref:hypothetical protein n=1 Tax=Aureivirga sp. CE67 TaxID=1788983 RepID=UPI0018CAF205|nr:hypothetical protein [Aureivirga sp. CE67]
MKKFTKAIFISLLIIPLTVITQIGGILFLISLLVSKMIKKNFRFKKSIVFVALYLIFTFFIIPFVAPIFGREKIISNKKIAPTNYMTILLNRNYVRPELNKVLEKTAKCIQKEPFKINYLDANFPFLKGFPLLPHLSHNDGKKIDISFVYESKDGKITNQQKSISGYGDFENPKKHEFDQTNYCKSKGFYQYDFTKYATFGKINSDLKFSEKGTKKLIQCFLKNKNVGKIFLEPHLKNRLKLSSSRIRFHGCRTVRHDDHIHVQLK